MVQIVVIDGYTVNPGDNPWTPLEELGTLTVHNRTQPKDVVSLAADADILITNKCPISGAAIERLAGLKFIAVTATGYNIVDVAAARRRGIPVSNVPEYGTQTVAQFTWALILELCHHVGLHAKSVAAGDWTQNPDFCYWLTPQLELAGKNLGLVGYGRIAQQVGAIGQAFGMKLLASGRTGSSLPRSQAVEWLSTDELFAAADVISLHCPLTRDTERMVNRALLGRIRPRALLINTSRGGLVNEHDLADALRLAKSLARRSTLFRKSRSAPRTRFSLRRIASSRRTWPGPRLLRKRLLNTTAENVAAFLAGKPINVVN